MSFKGDIGDKNPKQIEIEEDEELTKTQKRIMSAGCAFKIFEVQIQ